MKYNVPEDWKEVRSGYTITPGDFIGDPPIHSYGLLIGWKTPDGFVSPDKLPDSYKNHTPHVGWSPDYESEKPSITDVLNAQTRLVSGESNNRQSKLESQVAALNEFVGWVVEDLCDLDDPDVVEIEMIKDGRKLLEATDKEAQAYEARIRREEKERIANVIRKHDKGHLPESDETIAQSDHWNIQAVSILIAICDEFGLYEPYEESEKS